MNIKDISRRHKKIMLCCCFLYVVILIIAAAVASLIDWGGFIEFGFPMYLLIFAIFSSPVLFTLLNGATFISELVIYKSAIGDAKRFRYCAFSALLWELFSLMIPFSMHYSMLDKLLLPMMLCALVSILLRIVGVTFNH